MLRLVSRCTVAFAALIPAESADGEQVAFKERTRQRNNNNSINAIRQCE